MSRFPKPWFRNDRNSWFVTINGARHNLGVERKSAFEKFHSLMAKPHKLAVPTDAVVSLIDRFLEFVQNHRAPDTYCWYQSRLQLFATRYPDLTIAELRPNHVQEWIKSSRDRANGTKRNYAHAIQRSLRWGEEMGLVDRSPIAHFRKPRGGNRETVINEAD